MGSLDKVVKYDMPPHTHAKNITPTQHSPTCCFLCIQGVIGLHSQQSREVMPIVSLHQENFSVLMNLSMNLQHSSKCQPSPPTPSCLQPCLSQSDIEHQYALSLNDKLGSFQGILHSDYHNLITSCCTNPIHEHNICNHIASFHA
jgi:hypothetical protein